MSGENKQGIHYVKGLIPGDWDEWDADVKAEYGEAYYIEIPRYNASVIQGLLDKAASRPETCEENPEGITTVILPSGIFCVGADVRKRGETCLWINNDYTRITGSGKPGELGFAGIENGGTVIKTPFRFNEGVKGGYRANAIRIRGAVFNNSGRAARHHIYIENFEIDGGAGWTGYYEWDTHNKRDKDYGWDITHHGINVSVDDQVDYVFIKNMTVRNFRGEMLYIGGHSTGYLEVSHCVVGGTNASCNNLDGHTLYCHHNQWGLYDDNSRFWMEYSPRNCQTDTYMHQQLPEYVPNELREAVRAGKSCSYFSDNIYINSDYTQAACIAVAQAMNDDSRMYFINNTFDNAGVIENYRKKGVSPPEGKHSVFQMAGGSAGGDGIILIRGNKFINHSGPLYDHYFGGATGEGIWFLRSGNVLFEMNSGENLGSEGIGLISLTGSWAQYPVYADHITIRKNTFRTAEQGVISVLVGGEDDLCEGGFRIPWIGENGGNFTAGQPIKEKNVNNYNNGEITYGKYIILGDEINIAGNTFAGCREPVLNDTYRGKPPMFSGNIFSA